MRRFYEMDPDVNRYKDFEYDSKISDRLAPLRKGARIGRRWKPIAFEWYRARDRRKIGDFPSNGMGKHCPIFSQRAWDSLKSLISNSAEAFPVECPGDVSYVLVNVFDVVDCLDKKRSKFTYFSDGGVMYVDHYVFRESLLKGKHIFRVPENLWTVIVSEEFKKAVEKAALTGLDFRLLPGMKEKKRPKAKESAAAAPATSKRKRKRKAVRAEGAAVEVKTRGGTLTVLGSLPPVSERRLKSVEKSLGVKFPKAYRAFLRICNGGQPVPDGFRRPRAKKPCVYVQQFLEISDYEEYSLVESFKFFKREHNWLPESLMPIADDPGGSLICISVSGKDKGAVYFWDHEEAGERELEDPADYSDVTLIAADFEEFLAGFPKQQRKR